MEADLLEVNQELGKISPSLKKGKIWSYFVFPFFTTAMPFMIVDILKYIGLFTVDPIAPTIFEGNLHFSTVLSIAASIVTFFVGVAISVDSFLQDKSTLVNRKQSESMKFLLSKRIESEKEKLYQLQNEKRSDKNIEYEDSTVSVEVDDQAKLDELDHMYELFCSCAKKEAKFLEAQAQGLLWQKLVQEGYDETTYNLVQEYLNEISRQQLDENYQEKKLCKKYN